MFCTVRGFVTLAVLSLTLLSKFRPCRHSEVAEIGQLRALIMGLAAQAAVCVSPVVWALSPKSTKSIFDEPSLNVTSVPCYFHKVSEMCITSLWLGSGWCGRAKSCIWNIAPHSSKCTSRSFISPWHSPTRCLLSANGHLFYIRLAAPLCLSNKTLWQWQTLAAGELGSGLGLL